MRFGYSDRCLAHDPGQRHPESPDRLRAIRRGLAREPGVEYVEAELASEDLVTAVHDPAYVAELEAFCADGGGEWDPDTVAVTDTWEAARASAGLAVDAARTACTGATGDDTPMSLGRPPGHHATVGDAMGFCFLNNAAIAAAWARSMDEVDRVVIVDWDVHHGNGTQDIFYDSDAVWYLSIHEEGLYPGTGAIEETGTGAGAGATVNIPMPAGAGDAGYMAAMQDVIVPVVSAVSPDLVLVSAGFDPHRHDPISRTRVSTTGFGVMATQLRDVGTRVDAGLGFILEGGYGLETLSECVVELNRVFGGGSPTEPEHMPDTGVEERLDKVRQTHGLT